MAEHWRLKNVPPVGSDPVDFDAERAGKRMRSQIPAEVLVQLLPAVTPEALEAELERRRLIDRYEKLLAAQGALQAAARALVALCEADSAVHGWDDDRRERLHVVEDAAFIAGPEGQLQVRPPVLANRLNEKEMDDVE